VIFKERFYQCAQCANRTSKFAWDYEPLPECHGQMVETGHVLSALRNSGVIDDQLEGGPRVFENMGHEGVYIESKSQWRREMEKRGLVNVVRHDDSYYRKQRKMQMESIRDAGKTLDGLRVR
jgi:hypothetical protein